MGTNTQAQLSLRASQQSKSELIQNFDTLVDRYAADGAQLLKVVADPEDFWHGKSIYVFGANSLSSDGETIDWFDPDKHGKKYPSRALGDSSLDGQYALAGSQEFVRAFGKTLPVNKAWMLKLPPLTRCVLSTGRLLLRAL
nr:hypothetical protein [uncultured Rothia sp.]